MPICRESEPNYLHIGLVNNMPDAALESTEHQFRSLLNNAARDISIRLTFYALPGVPRSDSGRRHVSSYADLGDLWNSRLDGLIVSGTEPVAVSLKDEPYWASLTQLVDWAEHNTSSTVWSCLAAHGAVLYMDGVPRHKLSTKRFGVFECEQVSEDRLMAGISSMHMPHSRWNDLAEADLKSCGYSILARSDAGIDTFVKRGRSLFLFFQGHPEYDVDTLMLEYRRDIRRFLKGESEIYPAVPCGYFDENTVSELNILKERAIRDRCETLWADFKPAFVAERLTNSWSVDGARVYRNWLLYIRSQKKRSIKRSASRSLLVK